MNFPFKHSMKLGTTISKLATQVSLIGLISCTTIITNVTNVVDLNEVDLKKIDSYKRGETCTQTFFNVGPFGNSSILETAQKADIGKIHFVDTKVIKYLFYSNHCLVVYGS